MHRQASGVAVRGGEFETHESGEAGPSVLGETIANGKDSDLQVSVASPSISQPVSLDEGVKKVAGSPTEALGPECDSLTETVFGTPPGGRPVIRSAMRAASQLCYFRKIWWDVA